MRTLSLIAAVAALLLAGLLTGCGGGTSAPLTSAQIVLTQNGNPVTSVVAGIAFGVDVIPATRGGIDVDTASIKFFQDGRVVEPKRTENATKTGEIYILPAGTYGVSLNYDAGNGVQSARASFIAIEPATTDTTLIWNPVIRGYQPYTSTGDYKPAASYTLEKNGEQYLAKVDQRLVIEIDRVDHRGGPDPMVDPNAPLFKEVKVVVLNNVNAEVATKFEDYYWQNNLPVFSVNTSGDFTAVITIVLDNNQQLTFKRSLRVEDNVVEGPMTLDIKWVYPTDGSLRPVTLSNNTLWVLSNNRYNIKATKPGWENAIQEIVIFNTETQISPPLMVGNTFIQGLMSGTGEGTVRVMLRRPNNLNDYVYTDFHVVVIDGLGMVAGDRK